MSAPPEKVKITVYYRDAAHPIAFYRGSSVDSVLVAVWKATGMNREMEQGPFCRACSFIDEDGDTFALDTLVVPENTKVHLRVDALPDVKVTTTVPEAGTGTGGSDGSSIVQSLPVWEANAWYDVSDGGKTTGNITSDGCDQLVFSKEPFTSGKHNFRIMFSADVTYMGVGFVTDAEKAGAASKPIGNGFSMYPHMKVPCGTMATLRLDMDAKCYAITGTYSGEDTKMVPAGTLPSRVWLAVYIKHKRSHATILPME